MKFMLFPLCYSSEFHLVIDFHMSLLHGTFLATKGLIFKS